MKTKIRVDSKCDVVYNTDDLISDGNITNVYLGKLKKTSQQKTSLFDFVICNTKKDEFPVIVKVLKNSRVVKNLKNELDCLKELENESNIIHLISYNKIKNSKILVIELCNGGDLYNYYTSISRIFTENEVKIIILQIINAVKQCHRHNIVHADIKMENIGLVDKENINNLKLLDFGGSRKIDINNRKLCNTENLQCTKYYKAPEIFNKTEIYECDLIYIDFWEIGILTYVLLTKTFPFKADKFTKVKWPLGIDISLSMKMFVENLLSTNPHDRINLDNNIFLY
jgi:serine/threonine protein kinase